MGKVGDAIRKYIGIIILLTVFIAFLIYIEVQRTSPGNVVINTINTFVESTAIPVNNWLTTFHIWLPPLVCYLLGVFTLVVVPRLWSKKSVATSAVQKTADKIKISVPSPPATPVIPQNPSNPTPAPTPAKSEEILAQIEEEKKE